MASPRYVQMVKLALEDKAPREYRRMKRTGELEEFAVERANEIEMAIGDGVGRACSKKAVQALPFMERVREMQAIDFAVRETVFAELLDFVDDDEPAE